MDSRALPDKDPVHVFIRGKRVTVTPLPPAESVGLPPQPTPQESRTALASGPHPRLRLASVDILRGIVMVLMALDHVRDYFSNASFDPLDLSQTTTALYLTRWITHYCAPVFVVLAGMSAWLAGRKRTPRELTWFLASRGFWLVVLEFTAVGFGWYFNLEYELGLIGQVIWAIGVSMLVLAALSRLPRWAVAVVAVSLIAGHNLTDGLAFNGVAGAAWTVLHVPGEIPQLHLLVAYPLIPWVGVMAAGFVLGPWLVLPGRQRRRRFGLLGATLVLAFISLRVWDGYGDPSHWVSTGSLGGDILGVLNVTKYPPSLAYLLLTLGPAFLVLVWSEHWRGPAATVFSTFGKVALFYYVAHIYLVHALAVAAGVATGHPAKDMSRLFLDLPEGYGFGLPVVYGMWLAVVAMLYPVCRWYAERKRRGTSWWWSYV